MRRCSHAPLVKDTAANSSRLILFVCPSWRPRLHAFFSAQLWSTGLECSNLRSLSADHAVTRFSHSGIARPFESYAVTRFFEHTSDAPPFNLCTPAAPVETHPNSLTRKEHSCAYILFRFFFHLETKTCKVSDALCMRVPVAASNVLRVTALHFATLY